MPMAHHDVKLAQLLVVRAARCFGLRIFAVASDDLSHMA